jgi:type IV pilus assembly protein PilA
MRATAICATAAIAAYSVSGCNGKRSTAAMPRAETAKPFTDTAPLWRFAPPSTEVGFVFGDGSLELAHGAATTVQTALAKAPGGQAMVTKIQAELRKLPGLDPTSIADLKRHGLDLGKGAAVFGGPFGTILILPVADRKAFVALVGGRSDDAIDRVFDFACTEIDGRYVCADEPAGLDKLRSERGMAHMAARREKSLRGHIEIFASESKVEELGLPRQAGDGLHIAGVFESGGMEWRAKLTGKLTGPAAHAIAAQSKLTSSVIDDKPTALFVLNLSRLWKHMQGTVLAQVPDAAILAGKSPRALMASLSGDVVGYALPGQPMRGFAKIGLVDDEPAKAIVAACDRLPVPPGAAATLSKKGDHCVVSFAASAPFVLPRVELWVEHGALVAGLGDYAAKPSSDARRQPVAEELLGKPWTFAFWGSGAIDALSFAQLSGAQAALGTDVPPELRLGLWALMHLTELGFAGRAADDGVWAMLRVRTTWSNPQPVIDALEAEFALAVTQPNYDGAGLARIASDHPKSPWAADMKSGGGGLIPVAITGMLSAIAIPAFIKYIKKSKTSEAREFTRKMYDGARAYYLDPPNPADPKKPASLPTPSTQPTPPLGTCCKQGEKCAPDPSLWNKEPWKSLQFSIDDPHYYSYQYEVAKDGKSFTVTAYGDLDCDGEYSKFRLHGVLSPDGGGPNGMGELTRENELE